VIAGTVEFPRAAFTATQTVDGADVGAGPVTGGTGVVELEGIGTVEFVVVAGGVGGTLGGNDVVAVLLIV
jgi:hypothetical protein